MNWHLLSITEVTELLKTTVSGIDENEASERLNLVGKNEIVHKKKYTVLRMLIHQLTNFMIIILIVVAIISGFIGDITDTIIIIAIIIINAIIGFVQEYRAEKAMEALKKIIPSYSKVIRNGHTVEIPTVDLVPGDLVLLEAGNRIPADVRFIETHQLKVDESMLTGESHHVEKTTTVLPKGEYALGDRINLGFKGTFITNGRGTAYVTSTGKETELGQIAEMIQIQETLTPLQIRLEAFGKRLSVVILLICTILFIIGWLRGENPITMLLTSISLAVAAIPEAMPALITIALAFGAKKLVKSNTLIRKLPAVETLGSVTYICTDKTGTLTQNKMTVKEIIEIPNTTLKTHIHLQDPLLYSMALNNDVSQKKKGKWLGDATEIALVEYASNHHIEKNELEKTLPRVAEFPFDASRKCMTTLHQTGKNILVITKGAVDELLDKLIENQKKDRLALESKADELAKKGYRVLGFAIKEIENFSKDTKMENIESNLTLIGLVGIIDPPREEALQAITECKEAGIIPVLITGDHKLTAKAIAEELGIISSEDDIVLTGLKLENLTEKEFTAIVENVRVYARVNPEQKLKIINALQAKGQFVAMTGDGANDAPALKKANIGIAMGINGTEVTKEAADMILLDDNFATITIAIKHGRKIFDNILKFIKYTMTSNFGEIIAIFFAPFFNLPFPLVAIHLLWINLVTDGLPGLALASEPAESNIMKLPPKDPKKNIFAGKMAIHILWVGFLMGMVTLGLQAWAILTDRHWQTMAFTVLCFSQMGHVLAVRSKQESLFKIGLFSNLPLLAALLLTIVLQLLLIYVPFLNIIFKTQPLTLFELCITILASSIVFWAVEIEKWIIRHYSNK